MSNINEDIMNDRIDLLTGLGQSLWYDNIQRRLLENGELERMIQRREIRGVTSNPSIFHNAIAKTNDYDSALTPLAWGGWDAEEIFWQLAVEDIRRACDLFCPLYEETDGGDGYVSIEVSPYLAHETAKTVEQAAALWERVDRPNLMIKIPATQEGIPAIRQTIASGINVNVTLIFSLARYGLVMDAYLSGLEDRLAAGRPVDRIASVASFFVSRVDTKVDKLLEDKPHLQGMAAIANARLAYADFTQTFSGDRWEALQAKGARLQRPLWASTSSKNPAYLDTIYVNTLIGPHTVNTVPPQTLEAFRDHGLPKVTITEDMERVRALFGQLKDACISMDVVTQELEEEGVKAFADAFTALLATIEERRVAAVSQLGPLAAAVSDRISAMEKDSVPSRLWAGDPALWTADPGGQEEVKRRLGWLRLPETSKSILSELGEFADLVHYEGVRRILLLGMGGSSLAPEVMSSVFASPDPAAAEGKPCLSILDSTDPAQVLQAGEDFPPDKSLYVVSSKSGGTAEVMAALEYFWELSDRDGSRFIAITDPGTSLEKLAGERGFRRVFNADPQVGGRYSALTAFGLLPAALMGVDVHRLLSRAAWMMRECSVVQTQKGVEPVAARNPGLALGAVLGESALAGRDKLTVLADAPLAAFGSWLEQLIAESSGKGGKGIVPVDLEPVGDPQVYGRDRLFVYLRQIGEHDASLAGLREAGHPVLVVDVPTAYDLGAEFYRWEMATAIACHILGVNAFDQPNVEDAKKRAKARIAAYQASGALEAGKFVSLQDAGPALGKFLGSSKDGDYIAILAFLPRNKETISALQELRVAIRDRTNRAVTLGFGPRFLHSTGQLHKGGENNGLFLQITADPVEDAQIPTRGLSFGTLELAQALGDYEALEANGRRVLRVHISRPDEVGNIVEILKV
jgi:transaldolase/glucose-6-phosphate isomerase